MCESHTIAGGAAHGFSRRGFKFDSGPSFYCGLIDPQSRNPLRQVLEVLGESLAVVPYDPLGYYHFPEATFPVYSQLESYLETVAEITPTGAKELKRFIQRLLPLYDALQEIPTLALRSDWQLILVLLRYLPSLAKMLPHLGSIQSSVGQVMDREVRDPWVDRKSVV